MQRVFDAARDELRLCLDELGVGAPWRVNEGEVCSSDGSMAVRVAELHPSDPDDPLTHLEIGFAFDRARDPSLVWDSATGTGDDAEDAARQAVRIWAHTTAPPLLTMVARREIGDATWLEAGDPLAVPGWSCISGPYALQGSPSEASIVHQFLDARPLVPAIVEHLPRRFGQDALNSLKVFAALAPVGRSLDVRINGERHERASTALARLPWPAVDTPLFLRHFTLLVSPSWPLLQGGRSASG